MAGDGVGLGASRRADAPTGRILQKFRCASRLHEVIVHDSTNQHVRVDRYFHVFPAQACIDASSISSKVATFSLCPASKPTKPSMVPPGCAALSIPLASGNKSSSILSPGLMPKCCSTSFLSVTCARAVTVNIALMRFLSPESSRVMQHDLATNRWRMACGTTLWQLTNRQLTNRQLTNNRQGCQEMLLFFYCYAITSPATPRRERKDRPGVTRRRSTPSPHHPLQTHRPVA